MKKNKSQGFTLIELLVVIAVIGVLATIVLASLGEARKRASDAKTLAEVRTLQQALEFYYLDNGQYPSIPIADPAAFDLVAFCTDESADASGAGADDLIAALQPYMGGKLKIDKCIWYSGDYNPAYSPAAYCGNPNHSSGERYLIVYTLDTQQIPEDYYATYPESWGIFGGESHCRVSPN